MKRDHVAAAIGVFLAAGCGLLLHEFNFGKGLERSSYDLLHVLRGDRAAHEAAIVAMDEVSFKELNQPLNAPWDRALHAQLIDRLTAAGARAIVFDVVFSDPSPNNPAADDRLAKAMKQNGRVILAADNVLIGFNAKQIVPPFDLVRDSAASMGSDEVMADRDQVVRRHTPEDQLPALNWAAADFLHAKATQSEAVAKSTRWMNYYGPPNSVPWRSYYEALDPARVPDDFFRDKVVFIGAKTLTKFAGERKDEYRNPFSSFMSEKMIEERQSRFISGVEIQATACLNLLRGDWLRRYSSAEESLALAVIGILAGYGLLRLRPLFATFAAIGAVAATSLLCYLLFTKGLTWFPVLIISVQIAAALSWSVLFNSVQLYVEKRLYEKTLKLYLPPKLVKKFSQSREMLKPGAQKQVLTLLFTDIEGFTSITENMDPDEVAAMMNEYFEGAIANCIHKADGTVAKYLGDSIFAFWNAPDEQTNHALLACEAALLFQAQVRPIRGKTLHTRLGIHTGDANVGNFGSFERVDYTALGPNVNMASRLEGLNKHLGTTCLMSGVTKKLVGERVISRALGSFQLKGFEGLVEVHELISKPEDAQVTRSWREAFAEALRNYEQRNLEFAEMGFRNVLALRPDDGPSLFYLERIAELAKETLPENWATYTVLKEK